jgi:hypothetical protein
MVERYAHVTDAEFTRAVQITSKHPEEATRLPTTATTAAKNATDGNPCK